MIEVRSGLSQLLLDTTARLSQTLSTSTSSDWKKVASLRHNMTNSSKSKTDGDVAEAYWDDAWIDTLPTSKRVLFLETGSTFKAPKASECVWPPPASLPRHPSLDRRSESRVRACSDSTRSQRLDRQLQKAKIEYLKAKTDRQRAQSGRRVRRKQHPVLALFYWGIGLPCCILWGIPFVIAGTLALLTIIGVPIGITLWGIGGWPLMKLIQRRIK